MMEQLPPYEQWLKDRLTRWERFAEVFSPTDERLDYIAMALQLVAQQLATPVDGMIASAVERLSLVETKIDTLIDSTDRLSLISYPSVAHWGTASGGKDTKLIDETAYWQDNIWTGYEVAIIAGTGIGQIRKIESNDIQSLTIEAEWTTDLDDTSVYVIRRTRGIDIEAQSLGNLAQEFAAQSIGAYLQPEWAAFQGLDKNFQAEALSRAWNQAASITYRIPLGKCLYITDVSCSIVPNAATDFDHQFPFIMCILDVWNSIGGNYHLQVGGNGGMSQSFHKPIAIEAQTAHHDVDMRMVSYANVTVDLRLVCMGYEIDV